MNQRLEGKLGREGAPWYVLVLESDTSREGGRLSADGVVRSHVRGCRRRLVTLFGEVKVRRCGYSAPEEVSLFPLDGDLNLPRTATRERGSKTHYRWDDDMNKDKGSLRLYLAIIFITLTVSHRLAAEATLGRFPLCEASSALLMTCPGGDGECLLVGDNEQGKELYLFPFQDQKPDSDAQRAVGLHLGDGKEISDIEALAGVSGDEILVFASHSRNASCEVKPKRR